MFVHPSSFQEILSGYHQELFSTNRIVLGRIVLGSLWKPWVLCYFFVIQFYKCVFISALAPNILSLGLTYGYLGKTFFSWFLLRRRQIPVDDMKSIIIFVFNSGKLRSNFMYELIKLFTVVVHLNREHRF